MALPLIVHRLNLPTSLVDLLDHRLGLARRDHLVVQPLEDQEVRGDFVGKVNGGSVVVDLRDLFEGAADWKVGSRVSEGQRLGRMGRRKRTELEEVLRLELVGVTSEKLKGD